MLELKTVLYIDDGEDWARLLRQQLGKAVRMITAPSLKRALQLFYNTRQLAAIVIGGGGTAHELGMFATIVRPRFCGPIIAAHYEAGVNQELMVAGCTHSVRCKTKTAELVHKLI